jgi:hypothetical protein
MYLRSVTPHPTPVVFPHAVLSRAKVSRAEPSRAEARWLLQAVNSSWQHCLTTPVNIMSGKKAACETTVPRQSVNMVTTQQGNEARFPLSDWGFIRESVIKSDRAWIVKSPSPVKSIVIQLYRNDYRGSIWDTADGSTCVIVNCVNVRAKVQ